jgi:hypothetical protein
MSNKEQVFAQYRADLPARARDRSALLISGAFFGALTYATLRYNVFKGEPWADWPSYTLNKAFAFASLILIAVSVIRMGRRLRTSPIVLSASVLGVAHSLLSLALLSPLYYAKFYENGKLTALAGLGVTLGAAAFAAMNAGIRRSEDWGPSRCKAALAAVALAAGLHAALPAFASWAAPETWPGRMPPISLLSFLLGGVAIGYCARNPRVKRP